MNIIDLIPGGRTVQLIVLGVIAAALIGAVTFAVHHYNESLRAEGRAEIQAKWDKAREVQKDQAIAEAAANAKETQRRLARQKEAQDANTAETARLQAAAARVDADNGRLSGELAAFTAAACGAASDTGVVCNRKTASTALGMLAELYRSARTRAAVLGRTADAARAAGIQCTAEYDALTVKP